uniref:DUF7146 domain-containing protein n=1 Tax=Aureimonas endophytica TaxID=2027858 RepID=UPI001665C5DD|nr:hypothetical protein [Aureimonas endophytica]
MLARITDNAGQITGVARCWLDTDRGAVADIKEAKRVLGTLYGNAVRFGRIGRVLGCGEGIEAMLSVGAALSNVGEGGAAKAVASRSRRHARGIRMMLATSVSFRSWDGRGDAIAKTAFNASGGTRHVDTLRSIAPGAT